MMAGWPPPPAIVIYALQRREQILLDICREDCADLRCFRQHRESAVTRLGTKHGMNAADVVNSQVQHKPLYQPMLVPHRNSANP